MTDVVFQPYGAARTVTGSRHLFRFGERSVLMDCGLFQGHRQESRERNRHIPVLDGLEAVLLSHAHIDHSGALPNLVRDGFRGPIHATDATRSLCQAMLVDSAALHEADARHLNKRRKKDEPKIEPIYTVKTARRTLDFFRPHPYDRPFDVMKGVRATFHDAGHILGSAGILLEVRGGPSIYFTGDLGRPTYPILRDPAPLPRADVILSEATYGCREHGDVAGAEATLKRVMDRAVRKKGKVFVPAFSVGRTQNLVYGLAKRRRAGKMPAIPIFVDSPLALEATEAFVRHPECYDAEIKAFIGEGGRPFHPAGVAYLESREQSMVLNGRGGPFVVIAGSGMCEGGRITHHLLHGIEDPKNTILFVGYAAPNTLARRILDGAKKVRILGRTRRVRAKVERIGAYSAHADRDDLLRFLAPAREWGSQIHLVHGDEDACLALASALEHQGHRDVVVPETYGRYPLRKVRA
ncbi:MAG: MBL fold metallo-hydrolase RNA specificity domain-containing protein [Planctomycetota bacterium]